VPERRMFELPSPIQNVVNAVVQSLPSNVFIRMYGPWVWFMHTGEYQYVRNAPLRFVVSGPFDRRQFYDSLKTHITINREVESQPDKYYIVSDPYALNFDIVPGFDPDKLEDARKFGQLTIDAIFYDLKTKTFTDTTNRGINNLHIFHHLDNRSHHHMEYNSTLAGKVGNW